jgi:hypothetical protein
MDPGTLATIGSIIVAFGVPMLFFRIQRELQMRKHGEEVWLPWADKLLVTATVVSLLLVIVPITVSDNLKIPTAAVGASAIMVSGYVFAILAHYRIICGRQSVFWGEQRTGSRTNPEPSERCFVSLAFGFAIVLFIVEVTF